MNFFKVKSVGETKEILKEISKNFNIKTIKINLLDSLGQVSAENIYSPYMIPPFNRSTVDGYSLIHSDTIGASESIPCMLKKIGEVTMKEAEEFKIEKGQCVYVSTGGRVPFNSDSVSMIENTEKILDSDILIYKSSSYGENIIFEGEDIRKGELILREGQIITAYDISVLASVGIDYVVVKDKIKISILSTGDEIVDIDNKSNDFGKIRDVNGYGLYSLCKALNCEVIHKKIVGDNFDELKSTIELLNKESHLILMSGGSSVGERDYTRQLIESFENGEVFVHGIGIKPGKPTIIGKIDSFIIGLPGHPVSALIVFEAIVKEFLENLMGIEKSKKIELEAVLLEDIHSSPGRETYQMLEVEEKDSKYYARPFYGKSGMISIFSKSNSYTVISENQEGLKKGSLIKFKLLQEGKL